jgi:glycosyltransferase involved in cell wall biosynthesis
LTVVSTAIKEVFTPLADEHSVLIDVMPMWVDSNTFHPDNYNEKLKWKYNIKWPLLLFVGRLAEKKWVTYLLDAMPSVLKEYPDAKLLIVWWWPLEFILKNQSKELWLENSVIFTWPIPNWELPKYYATADLFIWPSIIAKDGDSEWFWLVFVEALMSGTPIIWSNLLWIKDILINEENWLFIKQKSAIDIYDSISWILSLDNLILRRSVLKYSRKNVSEKFYTIVK